RNAERKRRLAKIDAALVRLRENPDSFDLCDSCDDPLSKRLALMPWVTLCIECQREEDEANRYGGRRSLTDFIA
ncbi:MAG: TraR/DksA family transcriptional regulator, partial [Nannocystaceae bacterium]